MLYTKKSNLSENAVLLRGFRIKGFLLLFFNVYLEKNL